MRYTRAIVIILLILIADQLLKIYIKTNFRLYETHEILGHWFQLHFIENNGMAFGLELMGGKLGKILLSAFRLVAVIGGLFYLRKVSKTKASNIFITCLALIIAGAAGNLIDSLFYGQIFTASTYHTISQFTEFGTGYAPLFEGRVVDMLYFPLFEFDWPRWLPFIGGDHFLFFAPIFNIADAAITSGSISMLVFQRRLFSSSES